MAYGYGGYPVGGGYYPPPPIPDHLAQLRQNQYQPQMMNQPAQTVVPQQTMQSQPATTIPAPTMQTQPSTMSGPVFVNGDAGARGFMVAPGNTVMLIDADPNANTFWLKSADASGMPTMRTFDYKERLTDLRNSTQGEEKNAPVEYVTRADFDALADRASELEKELEELKAKKATTKKPTKEDDE